MTSSDPTADAVREEIRHCFSQSDNPNKPLSTTEIVNNLEYTKQVVEQNLTELADRGQLQSRKIDGERRVWWQPPESDSDEQQSGLYEFGAFVSAVKDYAIFMLDPDGTVISWNEGARRIKGYSEDDIVGRHFSTFYTEEDRAANVPEENLEKAKEHGRVEDEGWRVRQDGSKFWANVIITAIRDLDGTLQGFTKVTRDMTEQREYELQLRQERDLIEQIFETVPVGVSVIDSDREFVRANTQTLEFLAIDETDLETTSIDSIDLYDGDGERIPPEEKPWTKVIESDHPVADFQCQTDHPEGGLQWLSINAVPLGGALSDDSGIVVVIEDITDQKERESQLERRKAELETELGEILGRISDAFFALDEEWRFTHLNEQATELFQRSEAELSGQSFWSVFPDQTDGLLEENFRTAMAEQEDRDFELYDDQLDVWLQYTVYPSESGLSVYIQDITDRREYQQKLEESNERLEQFAHAASHDLQEPLRMISSYLQLIERRYGDELDETGEEFLEFAVDGADRMREMIEGLLTYSRVETEGESFEPADLNAVLTEAREDLQMKITESGAEITSDPLPTVDGDPNQLRQVFQNLLENAIEYSGEEPPRIHFEAERHGETWLVSVSDEGIGFEPDEADRIFDVFQRLQSPEESDGTGIGLALCERIVERHGGEIWAESEPGEGSTFFFTLPPAGDSSG